MSRSKTRPARTGRSRSCTRYPLRRRAFTGLTVRAKRVAVEPGREYVHATSFHAGSSGRLSSYPLGAVAGDGQRRGLALGIDMAHPAFYRIGYHAGTGELWIAYDLGLTPEKPAATVRFCRFDFAPCLGLSRCARRVLPALSPGLRTPGRRAGLVDAVRPDQPGAGMGRFRLPVQGGKRRDGLGRRARNLDVSLHRASDLVDADAQGHAADDRRCAR